jgi:hypothetical protein
MMLMLGRVDRCRPPTAFPGRSGLAMVEAATVWSADLPAVGWGCWIATRRRSMTDMMGGERSFVAASMNDCCCGG